MVMCYDIKAAIIKVLFFDAVENRYHQITLVRW